MYEVSRLENGLAVATAEMPHMASVSVGLWTGVGARYEPAAWNGISHFIEHLLFKGTRRRNAREISHAVESLGGYLNAFTSEEQTCFYAKAHHDHFDVLLDVLADMFLFSVFDPVEIAKEREVIKEELAMYMDQPQQYVQELLNATMWPGQPLGRSITGSNQSLDFIQREHLLAFQKDHYVVPATVVAAAGRIRHQDVVKAVRKWSRRFPRGMKPSYAPAVSHQTAPCVRLHSRKTEQAQVALGIRACSRHDERRFALRVLNAILGENMSSRLFQTIREEHGLAYSIYSGNSFFDDSGDLVISAGLDLDHLEKMLRLVLQEMERLKTTLVPAAELRGARDYLIGQMDLSLENSENQMMWVGEQWLNYRKTIHPDELKRRLNEVTASQVRAAAREFFVPQRYNLALVSPLKSAAGLEKILGNGSAH